jgi:hypothetical protein
MSRLVHGVLGKPPNLVVSFSQASRADQGSFTAELCKSLRWELAGWQDSGSERLTA